MAEKKAKKQYNDKWKDEHLVTAYEMGREGATEEQIAKVLGIAKVTLILWEKKKPLFKLLLDAGRRYHQRVQKPYVGDHLDYVYHQLRSDLKIVWQRLFRAYTRKASFREVNEIVNGMHKADRQRLFMIAMLKSNFNASGACRLVGINRNTVEFWKKDKEFQALMHEVHIIQKEWAQSRLLDLVDTHDIRAVQMENQAINPEKYGEANKLKLDVSGKVEHEHRMIVSIADMQMEGDDGEMKPISLNIQNQLLAWLRNGKKRVESQVVVQAPMLMETVG